MLTDNDKRDIEKQTGVALDKDQKGFLTPLCEVPLIQLLQATLTIQAMFFSKFCSVFWSKMKIQT